MKYCVFGFKKSNPKVAKERHNLSPNPASFTTSMDKFVSLRSEDKYEELYFIVDMGHAKELPFFISVPMDRFGEEIFPWFILGLHKRGHSDTYSSIDKMYLKLKGFEEEFTDSGAGLNRFLYYMKNNIQCELYCDINDKNRLFITTTKLEINRQKHNKNVYCRKYRLN